MNEEAARLQRALDAGREAINARYDDLRWCNKPDDCGIEAKGAFLALDDFDVAVREALEDGWSAPAPAASHDFSSDELDALWRVWKTAKRIRASVDQGLRAETAAEIDALLALVAPDMTLMDAALARDAESQ
jgi:hypothetical protein